MQYTACMLSLRNPISLMCKTLSIIIKKKYSYFHHVSDLNFCALKCMNIVKNKHVIWSKMNLKWISVREIYNPCYFSILVRHLKQNHNYFSFKCAQSVSGLAAQVFKTNLNFLGVGYSTYMCRDDEKYWNILVIFYHNKLQEQYFFSVFGCSCYKLLFYTSSSPNSCI